MNRPIMLAAIACAAVFASTATFEAYLLDAVSQQNKAQKRTVVCFDYRGEATHGDDWRECHTIAIRELRVSDQ